MNPSVTVPEVLCTCANRSHAVILLNACLASPSASVLHSALNETSAKYCAASVVVALEDLHKVGVRLCCPQYFCLISERHTPQRCLPRCLNVGPGRTYKGSRIRRSGKRERSHFVEWQTLWPRRWSWEMDMISLLSAGTVYQSTLCATWRNGVRASKRK